MKDQGNPIFLSGVYWDGHKSIKDAARRTFSLHSSDVDIYAWWAGDNFRDSIRGVVNEIGNACEPNASLIVEYQRSKSFAAYVRIPHILIKTRLQLYIT